MFDFWKDKKTEVQKSHTNQESPKEEYKNSGISPEPQVKKPSVSHMESMEKNRSQNKYKYSEIDSYRSYDE